MGKLHEITLGLDICSTLHMDVSLDDLDWCIEQIMPANPAYLMGLPTKNDPMLGYLTTAFQDHVRVRQNFGYKVDDALWDFFKSLEVIDSRGQPTAHFGDPIWVFYKYRLAKGDTRTQAEIFAEGAKQLKEVRDRGVWIAEKFGGSPAELEPTLDREIRRLYKDGRDSLWVEFTPAFVQSLPMVLEAHTQSADRKGLHLASPTGEQIEARSIEQVRTAKAMSGDRYNVQIIVSDGLCSLALTDDGHLAPYLAKLRSTLDSAGYRTAPVHIAVRNGRVRAGYQLGEILYSGVGNPDSKRSIIHLIGERPGSGHHTFSAYITAAPVASWSKPGTIDHNITKVVSGIADTAYDPVLPPARPCVSSISSPSKLATVALRARGGGCASACRAWVAASRALRPRLWLRAPGAGQSLHHHRQHQRSLHPRKAFADALPRARAKRKIGKPRATLSLLGRKALGPKVERLGIEARIAAHGIRADHQELARRKLAPTQGDRRRQKAPHHPGGGIQANRLSKDLLGVHKTRQIVGGGRPVAQHLRHLGLQARFDAGMLRDQIQRKESAFAVVS